MGVTLGERSPLQSDDVVEQLRICHDCVRGAMNAPPLSDLFGGPPYSLRACRTARRLVKQPCGDLETVEGR